MINSLPRERISAISQWQTFLRVLPTRCPRKPSDIEITSLSLSLYVYRKSCHCPTQFVGVNPEVLTLMLMFWCQCVFDDILCFFSANIACR